jgi:hypothetical protein
VKQSVSRMLYAPSGSNRNMNEWISTTCHKWKVNRASSNLIQCTEFRSFLQSLYADVWILSLPLPSSLFPVHYYHSISWHYIVWLTDSVINKKFWEELIVFLLIQHGLHRKQSVQQLFYCSVHICCLATIGRIHISTQTDGRDLWITPLRWAQVP